MVNFLATSRNRRFKSVTLNASHDSGASLDANPAKFSRPPPSSPRKQITSPRSQSEKQIVRNNNTNSKLPRRDVQKGSALTSRGTVDNRNPTMHRSELRVDCPRDPPPPPPPPVSSPVMKLQIDSSKQTKDPVQPLSPKSQNVLAVTSPKMTLKTGDDNDNNKDVPSKITPSTVSSQREKESWFSRSKKVIDDETQTSMTSDQTSKKQKQKKKKKKKGLFSRFSGRKDNNNRIASETTSTSIKNELVHEIIVNDTKRVTMNPIVETVGKPEDETKVENTPKNDPNLAKSPQHQGLEAAAATTSTTSFAEGLASLVRMPASTLSRSAKKHGSFFFDVFHSEPTSGGTTTPSKSTTPKQSSLSSSPISNSRTTTTRPLPPENPRQVLRPVDAARQQQWIVSVIEAIHEAKRMASRHRYVRVDDDDDDDDDMESFIDSDDSDLVAGPRVMYLTSGDLDDVSVSSIEMLFHWMTCSMDRAYPVVIPVKDPHGMKIAGDDFSILEDESSEDSMEY